MCFLLVGLFVFANSFSTSFCTNLCIHHFLYRPASLLICIFLLYLFLINLLLFTSICLDYHTSEVCICVSMVTISLCLTGSSATTDRSKGEGNETAAGGPR